MAMVCAECRTVLSDRRQNCPTCTQEAERLAALARSRSARRAVNESWGRTYDRTARTARARANSPTSYEYWLRTVTADRDIRPQDRAKAADNAWRAYQAELSDRAVKARAAKRAERLAKTTA